MAKTILDMVASTASHKRRLRVVFPAQQGDPYWVLLIFPYLRTASYENNRAARRGFVHACFVVTRLMYPDALDIVGFSTESGQGARSDGRSEDAAYFNARQWTPAMEEEARRLQKEYKLLTTGQISRWTEKEYPDQ